MNFVFTLWTTDCGLICINLLRISLCFPIGANGACKSVYPVPPDLPLVWKVEDGMLFLDDVWITPIKYLVQDKLDEAVEWVNPVVIELELIGGSVDQLKEDNQDLIGV